MAIGWNEHGTMGRAWMGSLSEHGPLARPGRTREGAQGKQVGHPASLLNEQAFLEGLVGLGWVGLGWDGVGWVGLGWVRLGVSCEGMGWSERGCAEGGWAGRG